MQYTIVNVSGTSSQVEKQSVTIGGARLRPGSSREVFELTPIILDWHEKGVLSISPPPGSTRPEKAVPTQATPAEEAPAEETTENVNEDADTDGDGDNEDVVEETTDEEVTDEETTDEDAPAEDAEEEETTEEAPEEDGEDETEEEEAPEEAEESFDVASFMDQNATDVIKAIGELDPDLFNEHKGAMYEYEIENKSRATVLKVLE